MAISPSRRKSVLISAAVAAAAVAAIFNAYGRGSPNTAEEAPVPEQVASPTVSVEPVRAQEIASTLTATGTVQARQETIVGSQASGLRLTEVLVEEGERVAEGELLARLDDTLLAAQLTESKAAVEQARATLKAAQSAAERAEKLLASKTISAETAEEKATTVKTASAQLAQAEGAVSRVEAELAQTEIRAPFAGVVSTRPAVVGSIVHTTTELMRIIRDGEIEIAVKVADKDLAAIAVGQAAKITDASGRLIDGRVSAVAQKVDETTRLGTVYIEPDEASELKPGMFARATISSAATETLSVAEDALIWRNGKPFVFVLGDDGRALERRIETGARKNGRIAVSSGLEEGDRVVVAGAGFLSNGDLVRVAANDAQTAANAE